MTTAAEFARRSGAKYIGNNKYLGSCTSGNHIDPDESMLISDGRDGNVELRCCVDGCRSQECRNGAVILGYLEAPPHMHIEKPTVPQQSEWEEFEAKQQRIIDEREQDKKSIASANRVFGGTVGPDETQTEYYFKNKRGISEPIYSEVTRHHPGTWKPNILGNHIAAVSKVSTYDGPLTGVHIIYLNSDGTKSELSPNKIMHGLIKGRGVWFGDVTDKLNIAEGIETALSVIELTGVPAVAALCAGNMPALIIPETVKHITIAADHDAAGFKAAQAAATKFIKQGIKTKITAPPNKGDDWNDVLQQKALEGVE